MEPVWNKNDRSFEHGAAIPPGSVVLACIRFPVVSLRSTTG